MTLSCAPTQSLFSNQLQIDEKYKDCLDFIEGSQAKKLLREQLVEILKNPKMVLTYRDIFTLYYFSLKEQDKVKFAEKYDKELQNFLAGRKIIPDRFGGFIPTDQLDDNLLSEKYKKPIAKAMLQRPTKISPKSDDPDSIHLFYNAYFGIMLLINKLNSSNFANPEEKQEHELEDKLQTKLKNIGEVLEGSKLAEKIKNRDVTFSDFITMYWQYISVINLSTDPNSWKLASMEKVIPDEMKHTKKLLLQDPNMVTLNLFKANDTFLIDLQKALKEDVIMLDKHASGDVLFGLFKVFMEKKEGKDDKYFQWLNNTAPTDRILKRGIR